MNTKDINVLLKKADELRALFVLGQRVIPFLEEIFVFVKEIQPMLDEINKSINENMKKMPGASEKLSKVTEANELATTEIMNTLDKMFDKTDKITANREQISNNYEKLITKPLELLEILRSAIAAEADIKQALPQIDNAIKKIKAFDGQKIKPLEESNSQMIEDINNDASAIMMSLQVQDITSQQIAAVDHMLRAIQGKLNSILEQFKNTDISGLADAAKDLSDEDDPLITKSTSLHREIAFDPNAISSIEEKDTRQADVDSWIDSAANEDLSEEDSNQPQAQDDFDAMFDAVSESESDDTEINSDVDEPQAQDDIDAMFEAVKTEETEESESTEEPAGDDTGDDAGDDDFDLSKFDQLGDNPDPSDIDALFSQGG